ncbi:maleylpyruvate isomerase family mycothiol-dependent enzyme [Pseudonocardia humida]|uniref:Maleylpyruvate isomerase family mycothiol-dependent enzyme n=1 Tax=Pseudonocardia humida TaxID=2800819 RepID=A0ABT1A9I4_9PSEU|nr:maleylpyruvate isomerase family mycothiol-dependent enzyme [Pseudonocardia humida]MCO1659663.1 maleylpyruvate isomerase family mycothiol-dependent enzyme [Pseudonocardia humida]
MDFAGALVEQGRLLADVIRVSDPATPVSTCPGWTLRQLVAHVGRGDRWAAAIVAGGEPVQFRDVPDGRAPQDPADAGAWLRDGARLLIDNVAAAPDKQVWTFLGPRPAQWWVRRRLHESTVHRADAALAVGAPYEIEPELAADGLSEMLDVLALRPDHTPGALAGVTLHLHATDPDLGAVGEWLLRGGDGNFSWEHGHAKATAAVRGRAADLLLAAAHRIAADDDRLEVLGDRAVWTGFLEHTGF